LRESRKRRFFVKRLAPCRHEVVGMTADVRDSSSPQLPREDPTTPFTSPGVRVLVVRENGPSRRILARILGSLGSEVVSVETGASARAYCRSTPPVALVVLEATLPDMDPSALVAEVRSELGSEAPWFVVCADRARGETAPDGVVVLASAPLDIQGLLDVARDAIARRDPRSPSGAPPRSGMIGSIRTTRTVSRTAVTLRELARPAVVELASSDERDPRRER
jgi:CheY-like chemotaxis protein